MSKGCVVSIFIIAAAVFLAGTLFIGPKVTPAGTGNIIDFDNDYDGGYYDSDSGGSYGGGSLFDLLYLLDFFIRHPVLGIIVIVIMVVVMNMKSKRFSGARTVTPTRRTANYPDRTANISGIIKSGDPNFSADAFIAWVKEVYATLDEAFCSLEWTKARPFESNELFAAHQKQIDEYLRNNTQPETDRLFVNKVFLTDYRKDANYEYIDVVIESRFGHCVVNRDTREPVKGDRNKTYNVVSLYQFKRSIGTQTNLETSNKSTTNCPNCGGTLDITSSGKCEWCGSVVTTGEYDWVLNDIQKLSQL
jgi:hypothetical protein